MFSITGCNVFHNTHAFKDQFYTKKYLKIYEWNIKYISASLKFINDLRQVGGFLRVLSYLHNKTDRHDIAEICLKVALNTITDIYTLLHLNILLQIFHTLPGREQVE